MLTSSEALRRLLDALPRCCACEKDFAVVYNEDRWGLCEKCFDQVPCGDFPPVRDFRSAVYAALAVLASEDSGRFRSPTKLSQI